MWKKRPKRLDVGRNWSETWGIGEVSIFVGDRIALIGMRNQDCGLG